MNLKPNLWTLLFVLAAGAWWYAYTSNDNGLSDDPDNGDIIEIPSKYQIDIAKYDRIRSEYTQLKADLKDALELRGVSVEMVLPSYYQLDQHEIQYIKKLSENDLDGTIYLIPVWEEFKGPSGCEASVSLVFMEQYREKMRTGDKAYNFVVPCPPLCKPMNGRPYAYICNE